MIFQENNGTFDLNKYDWTYYNKIYSDKRQMLKLFNIQPYSTKVQKYTIEDQKLAGYKIYCKCYSRLIELSKKNNITNLFILNNAFNKRNNNNQLASTKFYYPITKNSFEMYAGLLNHNTPNFCSFIKSESPLECQADGLYDYLVDYISDKPKLTQIFINPPFDEKSILYAINQTKKIIALFKKHNLGLQIQFTVPRWSPEDYEPEGIYYYLTKRFKMKQVKETFKNFWNKYEVDIDVSIFLLEI